VTEGGKESLRESLQGIASLKQLKVKLQSEENEDEFW